MVRDLAPVSLARPAPLLLAALVALCPLFAAPAGARGQACERTVTRTPLRFGADGGQVLVEVVERDRCFPDGVSAHGMERRRTGDLELLERTELLRGTRDWSDPSTWRERAPAEVEAAIRRRRGRYLRAHAEAFPFRAVRRDAAWEGERLRVGGLELAVPRALIRYAAPYSEEPPEVQVWVAEEAAPRVLAVGTVERAGRDRLVVLERV